MQLLVAQLRLDPQDVEARLDLGRLYETYNMEEPAREQYLRAVNLDPESQTALQGLVRIARRRADDAREVLPLVRAFVGRHPGQPAALNTLGTVLDATGDYPAAEAAYRQGLAVQPLAAYLYNNLGLNLAEQGRTAEAVPVFRRALELDPHSEVVRNNLGATLVRRGDQRSALRLFRDGGADSATAHNNLAAILLEQGQLEESRAEILESLNARSFFTPALENFKLLLEKDRALHALPGAVPHRIAIPEDWWQPQPAPPALETPREKKP
jgi:superkiller protein 3